MTTFARHVVIYSYAFRRKSSVKLLRFEKLCRPASTIIVRRKTAHPTNGFVFYGSVPKTLS